MNTTTKKIQNVSLTIARILLGLAFGVLGANGLLHFLPEPPAPSTVDPASAFLGALQSTGYMIELVSGTQLVAGVLLLVNRFVPLALALLAPVLVNIVAFHVVLAPQGLVLSLVFVAIAACLAYAHRATFAPLVASRA